MESESEKKFDPVPSGEEPDSTHFPEQGFEAGLHSQKVASERQSIIELTRDLARLPLDQAAAAIETSAAIAGVSLRASIEFLRAVPEAAPVLAAAELRSWGEIGRRLGMGDVEAAVTFFSAGVNDLNNIPREARPTVFQLCSRQINLSSSVATDTLRKMAALAKTVNSPTALHSVLEIAAEISRRSAKHSADFLEATPRVVDVLNKFEDESLTQNALLLASAFATRAGGIASDAWASLPTALKGLAAGDALRLLDRTGGFLERGGGVALHLMLSGGEILRSLPEVFSDWIDLLWIVAQHGNASLVAFARSGPGFIRGLAGEVERARREIEVDGAPDRRQG